MSHPILPSSQETDESHEVELADHQMQLGKLTELNVHFSCKYGRRNYLTFFLICLFEILTFSKLETFQRKVLIVMEPWFNKEKY